MILFNDFLNILDHSLVNNFKLTDLIDKNGINLLMRAVDEGKHSELIDEILRLPFDVNQESDDGKTVADIAWKNKNYQILLRLLNANSTFPRNFDITEASNEIKRFLTIIEDIHQAIRQNKLHEITEKIKKNSNLRYFYNCFNESAAAIALRANKYQIYGILLDNGCSIGPNEDLKECIDEMFDKVTINKPKKKQIKQAITETHARTSKQQDNHLNILVTNSFVSNDDQSVKEHMNYIKDAFERLNQIPLVRQILQLIAAHKNFKVYFDFNRNSVDYMNPDGAEFDTRGLLYFSNLRDVKFYFAAKELLFATHKFRVLGIIAHEMCHFAMFSIFRNNGKPYTKHDDSVNEKIFDKIVVKYKQNVDEWQNHLRDCDKGIKEIEKHIKACKEFRNYEDIIFRVYNCYDAEFWPAELIVRVPHMTLFYHNDQDKLKELKAAFKDLFDFYDQVIVPKISETFKMIQKLYDNSSKVNYTDLNDQYKAKIHNSMVNFRGQITKLIEIVDDKNSEIYQLLTSTQIRGISIDEKVIQIGKTNEISTNFYNERQFIDFDNNVIENMKNIKSFDDICKIANETKLILLSDYAGSGKTTSFKHFTSKLKEKFSNFWISFIDLKRYLKIYEKYEKKFTENDVQAILLEILDLTDNFEIKIFAKLFIKNQVILLFDSVDEIAPKFMEFLLKFINAIRNSTQNQQWIVTRPQHTRELKESFKEQAYKFVPYDNEMIKEFILQYLKSIDVKLDENVDTRCDNIANLVFQNFNNPLLLQIITDTYFHDSEHVNELTLYSLYERIIHAKIKSLSEKGEIVNQDRDNPMSKLTIWEVHQIYALKLLLNNYFTKNLHNCDDNLQKSKSKIKIHEIQLIKRWTKSEKSKWTPEQISRYGFLSVDRWNTENETPNFSHRTFAEFFVAKFLIENIFEPDDDYFVSKNELKMRFKLLVKLEANENLFKIIESFFETRKEFKFNRKILLYITSDDMKFFFKNKKPHDLKTVIDLVKKFSIDRHS